MIPASSTLFATACASVAKSASAALAEGAHSFASVLEAITPGLKEEQTTKPATKAELAETLRKSVQSLQELVRHHLGEFGATSSAPLTVEVDSQGKMTVHGDAAAANDWELLCAQHADLRDALAQVASTYEKYAAATAPAGPPQSPALPEPASSLKLLVRGDSVELLAP